MTEMEQTKMVLLKQMHEWVIDNTDDEDDLYQLWTTEAIPEEPNDSVYKFIATHEDLWFNCCKTLHKICLILRED